MAQVGNIALILALIVAVYSAVVSAIGGRRDDERLLASARNALGAATGLLTLAVAILLYALLSHDFSLKYVYDYSSRDTSVPYLISALWAGNSGSLLFWAWLLSLFALVVTLQKHTAGRELLPYASSMIMITEFFFLFVILATPDSNPFVNPPGYVAAADGLGLNPLLQNAGMLFHPQLLYLGYVGFTVPFAFAISALLTNRLDDGWIQSTRKYALITWVFLGAGNILGMWWAYTTLGWGGYWGWDAVENAGLLPWLVGTAFLHSVMMQRRRGMFKNWNIILIILAFFLSTFGTYLTRTGLVQSVHAFGDTYNEVLGRPFVVFLSLVLIGSFWLMFYRRHELKSEAETENLVSRESTFLLNNILFVFVTAVILVGTLWPLFSLIFTGTPVTVNARFYDVAGGSILLVIVLLAGICTVIGWRQASPQNLTRGLLWPLAVAVVFTPVSFLLGARNAALIVLFLCFFVIASIVLEWSRGVRVRHKNKKENYARVFISLLGANRSRYGGYIVHLGVVLMAIGVIASHAFVGEKEATLKPGDTVTVKNYVLTYQGMAYDTTATREISTATLSVAKGSRELAQPVVAGQFYDYNRQQTFGKIGLRSTLTDDLYVILESQDATSATFKVLVNPLVTWIWIGGIILVCGGLISFWPGRVKAALPQPRKEASE